MFSVQILLWSIANERMNLAKLVKWRRVYKTQKIIEPNDIDPSPLTKKTRVYVYIITKGRLLQVL